MRTSSKDEKAAILSWYLGIDEAKATQAIELIDSLALLPKRLISKTESPLERLFLAALSRHLADVEGGSDHDMLCRIGRRSYLVETQTVIAGPNEGGPEYRVDIAFDDCVGSQVVVELDGHDFHERTKEQAKSDRQRDRNLQLWGFKILRYTGSEVYADPYGCAEDLVRHLTQAPPDQVQLALDSANYRGFVDGYDDGLVRGIAARTADFAKAARQVGRFELANYLNDIAQYGNSTVQRYQQEWLR